MNPRKQIAFLASIALLNVSLLNSQQRVAQRAIVKYDGYGELRVEAMEPVGNLPKVLISEKFSGRSIFATNVGTARVRPDEGASKTILRFVVVEGPHPRSPMVLAVSMSPGGSDCGYEGVVVGEVGERKHRIGVLTPKPVNLMAEDGIYLGDLGPGLGYGLAVANFIWAEGEAHPDKHQYEVTLYSYDPSGTRFRIARKLRSKGKYDLPADAMAELGFHSRNLIRDIPDFAC
jgi:hypothetical protein